MLRTLIRFPIASAFLAALDAGRDPLDPDCVASILSCGMSRAASELGDMYIELADMLDGDTTIAAREAA